METIVLNSTNIIPDSNNSQLSYRPAKPLNFADYSIAIQSVSLFKSWYNISSALGTNQLSYTWLDNLTYTITFPDSYLDASGLDSYLQYALIQNGHYLVDGSGKIYTLISLIEQASLYKLAFQFTGIDTASATAKGLSRPSGVTSWSIPAGTLTCPSITIPNTPIQKILGFSPSTFPSTRTGLATQIFSSTTTPQMSPVDTLRIDLDCVQSEVGGTQTICSFTPVGAFGSPISYTQNNLVFLNCVSKTFENIVVSIRDQWGYAIRILDPSIVVTLVLAKKRPFS